MNTLNRRQFLNATALGTAALCLLPSGCASSRSGAAHRRIAFNTANLVARFTNYRFELKHWGKQHQQTVAMTVEAAWAGIPFNLENHPEKTAAETLAKVGGGSEWLGICVDTGWFATQAANVPEQIRAAGRFVRHTHIKDVKAAGAHETCLLGEGVADVAGCLAALREIGYADWYSWEDEPEDRNPFDSAVRNRGWIEARLRS